jgi:DNA-binding MarR family transcriptional regulator
VSADSSAVPPVSPQVVEISRAVTEMNYIASRARQHERLMTVAGLNLDRAAAALLRALAADEPARVGELAVRLSVESSHVTRMVQTMERAGYVRREPDPEDGRAQLVQLTDLGRWAVDRMRTASHQGVRQALAAWSSEDLDRLSVLFRRMVDDFILHAEDPSEFRFPD